MATKIIAWNTGSGNITLTYNGQGDGTISVQSDANDLAVARSQQITIETINGSPVVTKTVTISQAAMPNLPYADLGLPSGTLWAVGNLVKDSQGNYSIGAETDWGTYVSWGNIDGHNEGEGYNFSNDTYGETTGASVSFDIQGQDSAHNIAFARLGAPWNIPTQEDYHELLDNTDTEWVANYNGTGVTGMKFMKKTDHSVFVFFSASGYYNNATLASRGEICLTWTKEWVSSNAAMRVMIQSSGVILDNFAFRRAGATIRPIQRRHSNITLTLSETDDTDVYGKTVTVTDSDDAIHTGTADANGQVTFRNVAYGECTVSVADYVVYNNGKITVSNSVNTFTLRVFYRNVGVYAYYSDGSLKSEANADSSAIGVAVITNNCAFVIDKVATNNNNTIRFGGYNKNLSGRSVIVTSSSTTAKTDFNGYSNTAKLIKALNGYNDGYSTGAPACEACRAAFNGQGYMGSLGEWNEAYANKASVNSMMTKIGGTAISSNYHWASTLYNASVNSWVLNWSNGGAYAGSRDNLRLVRAFRAL